MDSSCYLLLMLLFLGGLESVSPTHLRGKVTFKDGGSFVTFLSKFGIKGGHDAFFFGRSKRIVHSLVDPNSQLTLAFIPLSVWKVFYHDSKASSSDQKCQNTFTHSLNNSISTIGDCKNGTADYLRRLPCEQSPCNNQPSGVGLIGTSEFTYRIRSTATEFYYAILIACTRNATVTCNWASSADVTFTYDMHIVNQDPDITSTPNPYIYEFSYELQGILIVYMVFSMCYIVLIAFQIVINTRLCTPENYIIHRLVKIFTVSIVLELIHVILILIHYGVFAHNGIGVVALKYLGEVSAVVSDWFLILVLILIGKGWQLTTSTVRRRKVTFVVWVLYIVFSAIYFMWMVVEENVYPFSTYTIHPYQTWAGGLFLAYRLLVLVFILYELRQMYLIENGVLKLWIYRCLIILLFIWFCFLPLAVIIASAVNPLERVRIISSAILVFDFLINFAMVLLLCPKWADQYFQFNSHLNILPRMSISLKAYGGSQETSSLASSFQE